MMWISVLLVIIIQHVSSTKYYTREDVIAPDFDWSQLAVTEHFFQDNQECSFVKEEVTVFQFTKLGKKGKPINSTVTVAKGNEVDIRTFYDATQPNNTGKKILTSRYHVFHIYFGH